MKIENSELITKKEGYEAMLYMLQSYLDFTGSEDLTDILSGGSYIMEDTPGDSAFWEYWLDAVNKVKKDGSPPLQKFTKDGINWKTWDEATNDNQNDDHSAS